MDSLLRSILFLALVASLAGCQVKQELSTPLVSFDPAKSLNPANIPADSPAWLCPADARLFLQFDDMAGWRSARQNDGLIDHLWKGIAELRPPGMWDEAAKTLGIDEATLTDRYFGKSMAIIGESSATNTSYAIVSRVDPGDLNKLAGAMRLKPAAMAGKVAPYKTFTSQNDQLVFALHDRWLIVGPVKNKDWIAKVAAFAASRAEQHKFFGLIPLADPRIAAGPSLVDDDDFQKQAVKLGVTTTAAGRGHALLLYTRDRDRKSRHIASVEMDGAKLVAQYCGTIHNIDELYQQFGYGSGVDFGFIPASAISAASVNLVKKDAKGLKALNLFLFPDNIEDHVLPKLAAPMIVFLGRVEGDKVKPNPGVGVPAVGVAVRMSDPSVKGHLDRIVGGLRFMANVGQLDVLEGVFGGKQVKSGGLEYRVAEFGKALVKQIKDPDTAKLFALPSTAGLSRLYYGRIGDWFVVCSQEALYKECAAAYAMQEMRLTSQPAYREFPFETKEGLMVSGLTRAPELAAMTKELSEYWKRTEAKSSRTTVVTPDAKADDTNAQKIRRPMEWIANAIKHRDSFYIQVWRDPDGDLRGKMSTVEPVKTAVGR